MGPQLALTRRAIRRNRLQFACLTLVVTLATAALYLGLLCLTQFSSFAHERGDQLAAPDGQLVISDPTLAHRAAQLLKQDNRTRRVESGPVFTSQVGMDYNGSRTSAYLMITDLDTHPEMGRTQVTARADASLPDPVYVPDSFRTAGGYHLGDQLVLDTAGGATLKYRIQGFTENLFNGTLSLGTPAIAVPHAEFTRLTTGHAAGQPATLLKVRTADPAAAADVLQSAKDRLARDAAAKGQPVPYLAMNSRPWVESGIGVSGALFGGILSAVGVLLAGVTVIVLSFLVRVGVARDMVAIGSLKAIGLTPGQVLRSVVSPYLLLAITAGAVGVVAAVALTPVVAGPLAAQTGLTWRPAVSVGAALGAGITMVAAVLLAGLLNARRVRTVPVVEALRGDTSPHSFRSNHLPLDRTRGPLTLLLGIKGLLQNPAQSTMVGAVVTLVTLALGFSAGLYLNLLGDRPTFTGLLAGDTPSLAAVTSSPKASHQLLKAVQSDPAVDRAQLAGSMTMTTGPKVVIVHYQDAYDHVVPGRVVQGREPQHPNEVAIGAPVAAALSAQIGDEIPLTLGGVRATYLVTGTIQTATGLGARVDMTTAGLHRISPRTTSNYLQIWLRDGSAASREGFMRTLTREHRPLITSAEDVAASTDTQLGPYGTMAAGIAAAIVAVTTVVVIAVLGLVVMTQLVRRRTEDAIQLALGTTPARLRRQALVALLLPVILGALVATVLAPLVVDRAFSSVIRGAGLVKVPIHLAPLPSLMLAGAMVLLAAAVIWIATHRLRRISPMGLFAD